MKGYKWLRGLLKASALTTVMFVMQACYGAPQYKDEPFFEEEETNQVVDTIGTTATEVLNEVTE